MNQLVLIVEDNPGDVFLIEEALREHNVECELVVVDDGGKARDYFSRIERGTGRMPDLILLDLNLPKIPGLDVLRRIRHIPACNGVKVIVVSSSEAPRDRQEARELGADDYIRKPSMLDEYLALGGVIKSMLNQGE